MTAGPYSIGGMPWPGLSKLIEECGEVLQVVGKLIATSGEDKHFDGSDLRVRISEELGDVLAAVRFVIEANGLDVDAIKAHGNVKLATFWRWHKEQGS